MSIYHTAPSPRRDVASNQSGQQIEKQQMKALEIITRRQTVKLEASLRRNAARQGLILRKCCARDPRHPAFGTHGLGVPHTLTGNTFTTS
jgi:hypothetical protein